MKYAIIFLSFFVFSAFPTELSAQQSIKSAESVNYISSAKIHVTCDLYDNNKFEGRVSINHSGCPSIKVSWIFYNSDGEEIMTVSDYYSTCNNSQNFKKKADIPSAVAKNTDAIHIQIQDRN